MEYLIITKDSAFFSPYMLDPDWEIVVMVIKLRTLQFTQDGVEWKEIQDDHL